MSKINPYILIGIGLVIAFLFLGSSSDMFSITGSETMSRDVPSEVSPGNSFSVTYSVSGGSGKWAASVVDTLTCNGNQIEEKRFVIISEEGNTLTKTYSVPNEETTCTLLGDYKFGEESTKSFSNKQIEVPTEQAEKKCYNDDVYWYNSLGERGELVEQCSDGCEAGECRTCNTEYDEDCDNYLSTDELDIAIGDWKSNSISRTKLGEIIEAWAQ